MNNNNNNKKYDIISFLLVLITFMMILLSINIFFINNRVIIAKAENTSNKDGNKIEKTKENLFIHIINKSMSILEINYKENGGKDTGSLVKDYLGKVVDLNYKKPKSLIKAQIPLLKDVESDIDTRVSLNSDEDYDTRDIYIAEENINKPANNESYGFESYKENNLYEGDIQIINLNDENENQDGINTNKEKQGSTNKIEIISTPVPPPKKIEHPMNKPLIFIYHTHGTESYKPETIGNYHSLNRKYTVIRVGELMKENLENYGFGVIHDDTIHDHPSYQGSYSRSLDTLNKNLKANPSLKVIFDIHRDGINKIDELEAASYEGIRRESYTEINGEKVATYSIVIGGGNENVEELKRFAYYIKAISDEMYPGFATKIIIKQSKAFKYKLNQYKSDYYALFEIGSNANTIEEAERAAKYLSKVINQALKRFVTINN
ncbi:stage II sporulation protein P [Paramaledivibacter caminithermalis]|jgi:stage II sporulation protein P|uniref:Stage II sporulation protein P n=1 Tax=Paramaledivibacter caminithermalis (strain DSM 15212 / CIP 107654 / DViRD3) TaxID=1121301 RepID=A0A1M6M6N4_PARC5|nr:stage II sporulation protein P [Paramaledivibacter caminithermalis]SHJ79070.1 stage II sporulation protein P [Paramaledivibacter caminithermalis DSM 15212]